MHDKPNNEEVVEWCLKLREWLVGEEFGAESSRELRNFAEATERLITKCRMEIEEPAKCFWIEIYEENWKDGDEVTKELWGTQKVLAGNAEEALDIVKEKMEGNQTLTRRFDYLIVKESK